MSSSKHGPSSPSGKKHGDAITLTNNVDKKTLLTADQLLILRKCIYRLRKPSLERMMQQSVKVELGDQRELSTRGLVWMSFAVCSDVTFSNSEEFELVSCVCVYVCERERETRWDN